MKRLLFFGILFGCFSYSSKATLEPSEECYSICIEHQEVSEDPQLCEQECAKKGTIASEDDSQEEMPLAAE